jgi:SAM-dependent methyltransferase
LTRGGGQRTGRGYARAVADLPLTSLERRWREIAPPQAVESARAIYELLPALTSAPMPGVTSTAGYDPLNEWHWAQAARVADFAARAPEEARVVIDIGPGDGWPSLPLAATRPGLVVLGVEPSPRRTRACVANAARQGIENAHFLTGDVMALPLARGSADYVVASYSVEEAREPERALAEIARVLRPDGVLRIAYQDWRLPAADLETVSLLQGRGCLLYGYARRMREPALERRYALVLPEDGETARLVAAAMLDLAAAPRAFGETLLVEGSLLGAPLLERLAPLARRSLVVEMRRWTTEWLADVLRAAGFAEVRATAHPGDLARAFARALRARGALEAVAPRFEALASALGEAGGEQAGRGMVTAVR